MFRDAKQSLHKILSKKNLLLVNRGQYNYLKSLSVLGKPLKCSPKH